MIGEPDITVSFVRRVRHGRQTSVPPRGTSNETPLDMDYRECVCMTDRVGTCFQHDSWDTSTEWCRW